MTTTLTPRTSTWQEDENGNPLGNGWGPWVAWNIVGLVPVVGPVAHAVNNMRRGNYTQGAVNIIIAGVDLYKFGRSTNLNTSTSMDGCTNHSDTSIDMCWIDRLKTHTETPAMKHYIDNNTLHELISIEQADITARIHQMQESGKPLSIADMCDLQTRMNGLSQLSERLSSLAEVTNTAIGKAISGICGQMQESSPEIALQVSQDITEKGVKETIKHMFTGAGGRGVSWICSKIFGEGGIYGSDATALAIANTFDDVIVGNDRLPLTADEVKGVAILSATRIPTPTLADSYFLKYYDKCPRSPTADQVHGCMSSHATSAFRECLKACHNSVSVAAVRLWTMPAVYKAINAALLSDNPGLMNHWVPYIRALNNALMQYPVENQTTTRRKSWMTLAQAATLNVGSTYRLGMYTATSTLDWANFPSGVGGTHVRLEFIVPQRCLQASDISAKSFFPNESEILLLPYAPVTVMRKVTDPASGVVTIYFTAAIDGRNMPLDLPTVVA